jgi:hypothetical protein
VIFNMRYKSAASSIPSSLQPPCTNRS